MEQILRIYNKLNRTSNQINTYFIILIILFIINISLTIGCICYIYKINQPQTIILPPGVTIEELEVLWKS